MKIEVLWYAAQLALARPVESLPNVNDINIRQGT
jgi:hypothetical protein